MMEIRTISQKGINFIAKEEGCVLHPYKDSVGVWTIGMGNTYYEDNTKVKSTDPPISQERAYKLFRNIIKTYETAVHSLTRDDINQNQFDALVSLCYNIGVNGFRKSTLLKKVNANPKDPSITEAFKMWRSASGKPILLPRRIREAKFYFS